ncbi:hypothetical protein Skadi11_9 [Pelagibacter phage Skadi-11 EXVC111P]|nr:hypothetical protein Skadi11_9 [Pelagibacter phage Skadi-11 EXVC111P]
MGAGNAGSNGGGRTDSGQMNSTTATKIGVGNINEKGKLSGQYKSNNPDAFRNRGAEKIKKGVKTPSILVNVGARILSKPLQAGSKVTRDFYTDKVLGSKNFKGQSKTDFLTMSAADQEKQYKSYIDNRTSGKTDAYGNVNQGYGKDNDGNIQTQKVVGGKTILVKEPTVEETKKTETEKKEYDARQTKKKGRTKNVLTSSKGVMKTAADYSLGKKSLLGQVV